MIDIATPLTMVLAETTGTETIYYLHGLDLIGQSDGASAEYFAYDGLGSVRQVLDDMGEVLLAQGFDPYGNPYVHAGEGSTSWGFTGEQTDANGLLFLRARYYQPYLNRFIQLDTIVPDPRKPLDWNKYAYVRDNPVNFTDPSGNICLDPWAPSGVHFDPNRGCDYPEGSTGAFWWRRDPLGPDTAIIDILGLTNCLHSIGIIIQTPAAQRHCTCSYVARMSQ